jgi:nitrous oxidase accessory protein NosD
MKRVLAAAVVATLVGVLSPGAALAAAPTTRVVDDDGAQCGNAGFQSVAAAVAAANPGDTVKVCAGLYRERVEVTKRLRLIGQPDAIAAVKCVDETWSSTDAVDSTVFPVLEPPDPLAGSPLRLRADGVEVAGLVVQGQAELVEDEGIFAPAIQADGAHAGHWIHHNLIQRNALGVELGSNGASPSRVDDNCLRGNEWGVANQRYATSNVQVDHNTAFATRVYAFEVGTLAGGSEPRFMRDARFDHNRTVGGDFAAFLVLRAESVQLDHNTIEQPGLSGIEIRGESRDIRVTDNQLTGTLAGVGIGILEPLLEAPGTSTKLVVANNTVENFGVGVRLGFNARTNGTRVLNNTIENHQGLGIGILINSTNTKAAVQGNVVNYNAFGIRTTGTAAGNRILGNSMHANTGVDAMEGNFSTSGQGITLGNIWQNNRCDTDSPPGSICGR